MNFIIMRMEFILDRIPFKGHETDGTRGRALPLIEKKKHDVIIMFERASVCSPFLRVESEYSQPNILCERKGQTVGTAVKCHPPRQISDFPTAYLFRLVFRSFFCGIVVVFPRGFPALYSHPLFYGNSFHGCVVFESCSNQGYLL